MRSQRVGWSGVHRDHGRVDRGRDHLADHSARACSGLRARARRPGAVAAPAAGAGCARAARGRRRGAGPAARSRRPRRPRRSRSRAERGQAVGVLARLRQRARRVVAARHHDDDLRLGRRDLLPVDLDRRLGRLAEQVHPAGVLDQLRRPVPGDEQRVEPLERSDAAAAARRAPRGARGRSARRRARPARSPSSRRPVACAIVRTSASASPSVWGSSAITRGRDGSSAAIAGDLVVGDRADRAERLRDDQVGLERGERCGVQLVDRLAARRALAHRGVDRARRRGRRGSASRVSARQLPRRGRVVALVRDRDKLIAEAEREEELGRMRDEADDPHPRKRMEPLSDAEIEPRLAELGPAWRREGDALVSDRECADFAAAIALVERDRRARPSGPTTTRTCSCTATGGCASRSRRTRRAASPARDFALAAAIDALHA